LFAASEMVAPTSLAMFEQQFQMARDYLAWCSLYPPVSGVVGQSVQICRGHFLKILHRYWTGRPEMRDKLAGAGGPYGYLQTVTQLHTLVEQLYGHYLADPGLVESVSHPHQSWYRRHWQASEEQRMTKSTKVKTILTRTATTLGQGPPPESELQSQNSSCGSEQQELLLLKRRKDEIRLRIASMKSEKMQKQNR
jgi:hypothetical protein